MCLAERISSERGYYTDECFEKYVDFLLDESKGGIPNDGWWRVLVVDGYGSHTLVPTVLKKFKDRRILMITMPSHTSHELQPLDVSCFKPTKSFFSWCLRHIFGTQRIQEIQKAEAPTYFQLALSEGGKSATIVNGFRATGLFPFNPKFVQENPEKFQMADTLDADKMNAKIFGHNENSTVSESYKMLVTSTEKLDQEFAGARSVLQEQYPDLCASISQVLESRKNLEVPFKEVAAILTIPDSTKIRKTGPARLNIIGETFHESRVLNREARIARLEERLEEIRKLKAERAAKKAQKKEHTKATKAAKKQVQLEKIDVERPVLVWLKEHNYAPPAATTIAKAHVLAAFEDNKDHITEVVKKGGDKISKSTSLKEMVRLFNKYALCQ